MESRTRYSRKVSEIEPWSLDLKKKTKCFEGEDGLCWRKIINLLKNKKKNWEEFVWSGLSFAKGQFLLSSSYHLQEAGPSRWQFRRGRSILDDPLQQRQRQPGDGWGHQGERGDTLTRGDVTEAEEGKGEGGLRGEKGKLSRRDGIEGSIRVPRGPRKLNIYKESSIKLWHIFNEKWHKLNYIGQTQYFQPKSMKNGTI